MRVTLENGVELHNFYVPAGGDIPDPEVNEKFAHKLELPAARWRQMFGRPPRRQAARGRSWSAISTWRRSRTTSGATSSCSTSSATRRSRPLLGTVKAAFDWTDVTREFVPQDEKIYSWWSYRAADWRASNRGRRLDHIWVGPALKGGLKSQAIITKMRGWQSASDHVPVVVEVEV